MNYNYLKLWGLLTSLMLSLGILSCDDDQSYQDPNEDAETHPDPGIFDADIDEPPDSSISDAPITQEDDDAGLIERVDAQESNDLGQFGDHCQDNSDCESDLCHTFGQASAGSLCTLSCEKSEDCPKGETGELKCNKQNVCRP